MFIILAWRENLRRIILDVTFIGWRLSLVKNLLVVLGWVGLRYLSVRIHWSGLTRKLHYIGVTYRVIEALSTQHYNSTQHCNNASNFLCWGKLYLCQMVLSKYIITMIRVHSIIWLSLQYFSKYTQTRTHTCILLFFYSVKSFTHVALLEYRI